jgi:hypothetical protein
MSVGGENGNQWGMSKPEPGEGPLWYPAPDPSGAAPWYPSLQSDAAVQAPYEGLGGNPPRSLRRGRLVLVMAMAAATGLIAVILALVVPGGTRSAQAAVIASVNNAVASKTARASMTMNINSGQITSTGSGALDFTNGAMDMTMDMSSIQQGMTIRVIYLAGKIFEQFPQISQLYPGKTWLSLDLSGLTNVGGGTGALSVGGNPMAMLRLLAQQGANVTPVGNSEIDGVPAKGYAVTIDSAFIDKQISAANVPSWMRQAISNVNFQDAVQTVFIDNSGKLIRDALHMVISIPAAHQPAVTIDETLDLSDYGAPVSITSPPASQVLDFQQFLQSVGSQATS